MPNEPSRTKPNYREIYDDVFLNESRYNWAEHSPGLQAMVRVRDQLNFFQGRSLDVGCGAGFGVEYLSGPAFKFQAFGVDVSEEAIDRSKQRLAHIQHASSRLLVVADQRLPFEDDHFSLVTCFDVLEHLDESDIELTLAEIERVLRPGGLFLGAVSCRPAGMIDKFGDNLHRTVRSTDWWIETIAPDRAEYEGTEKSFTMWKCNGYHGKPLFGRDLPAANPIPHETPDVTPVAIAPQAPIDLTDPHNSTALYQEIYEQNEWYGNAQQDRCPGVRLIPEYQDWIKSPILDLGCGRGHTVEKLRELGFQAEGIDQIRLHPEMKIGDISKPLQGLDQFHSVTCIDCIEHLYEEQVLGLFENMKQFQRQAFSIHNGPSNDTGQELHVNRLDFTEWHRLIGQHFKIAAAIKIHDEQMLYLTERLSS